VKLFRMNLARPGEKTGVFPYPTPFSVIAFAGYSFTCLLTEMSFPSPRSYFLL
jgi:hypothetical protein